MLKFPKSKLHNRIFRAKVMREVMLWSFLLPAAFAITWFWAFRPTPVSAAVTPLAGSGNVFYGDATNAGIMRSRLFTSTATWAAEHNGITGSASNILWTRAETAPTREEMMIGSLRVNGTLQIESCTTACDANGDYTNQWANAGTSATQDCDAAPTVDTCVRSFDIAYEALKGRSMVAYTDSVGDKFYYALWDGSAWSPDASPDSPSATNEIDFNTGGTGGTPLWIRAVSQGENLDNTRSDRVMVLLSDNGDDLWACYWDGSSFSCLATALETSLQNCTFGQCFDGAWQDHNTFVAVYYDTVAATMRYQVYTVGIGWGGEQDGPALSTSGEWITATSSPTSTRILVATNESGDDARSTVWRANNTTDGWTTCAITDCPDTATETSGAPQAATAFERLSGEGLWVYNDAANGGTPIDYSTYTPTSTWGAVASTATATGDDALNIRARGSPNGSSIMVLQEDVDCELNASQWNGASWDATTADLELDLSNYGATCPNQGTPAGGLAINYDFTWKIYTPWQRNWQFFDGADTASSPTTTLAAENTQPTDFNRTNGIFRLRINYAERGRAISNTDARKKLQYTKNCNPNIVPENNCTWTDVDDPAGSGIWRYRDLTCTATDCADNTTLTATKLTGSSTCTAGLGCGTWVLDKDAAGGTNMDHTAQSSADTVQESEWIVEANNASGGSIYYFRIYNIDQDTPIYREQDANDCSGGAAQCTYPSIDTDGAGGPTTDEAMRHGSWFNGGAEQTLFWVD